MYSTRIPRIALVTVLCLLMVSSASVAVAQSGSIIEDFEDQSYTNFGDCATGFGSVDSADPYEGSYSLSYDSSDGGVPNSACEMWIDHTNDPDNVSYWIRYESGDFTISGVSGEVTDPDVYELYVDDGVVQATDTDISDGEWYRFKIYNINYGNTADVEFRDASGDVVDTGTISLGSGDTLTASGVNNDVDYFPNIHLDYFGIGTDLYVDADYSTISGTVTDGNNENIEGVTMTARQNGSVVVQDTTNQVGQYNLTLRDGTYNVTASKQDYREESETITVSGSDVTQDFQLVQFNQSINLDTKRYIEHGQRADYRVIVTNDTGRHNVTGEATVTSGNESVVTVDTDALQLQATTDISVNDRTPVTAEWNDSEGNVYTTQTNVTVANATVANIDILPTWTKTSASLGDETLQLIIVATMIGAGAALVASSFAGLSAATGVTVLGWFAGMASDGVLIVSFMMAVFIGLNLAGNINMQVGR